MILTDSGPLVALYDRADEDHALCRRATLRLEGPMISTWPVFTEAMHLLGKRGRWPAQHALWQLWLNNKLEIADLDRAAAVRMEQLMGKYADVPMDLADASLVVLAEIQNLTRIFTIDAHFRIYRLKGRKTFEIIPG